MIQTDTIWLAVEPLDMCTGIEAVLAQVVKVPGAARPHHVYLSTNESSMRMKVLIYDGSGIWPAARHLSKGRFVRTNDDQTIATALNPEQLHALVMGLPWQTFTHDHAITVV